MKGEGLIRAKRKGIDGGEKKPVFQSAWIEGFEGGKAREAGKTAGRRGFDARQRRGRLEEEDGAARWAPVVSDQRRGEAELGCWAAWKLGTVREEVGRKRECRPRGVRWADAGKGKKESGPLGKGEEEKEMGRGVLGQKGGGEGFGVFFKAFVFSKPFQTLNSNSFQTFKHYKLFQNFQTNFKAFKTSHNTLKHHAKLFQ
jgi:hypothetical protein